MNWRRASPSNAYRQMMFLDLRYTLPGSAPAMEQ